MRALTDALQVKDSIPAKFGDVADSGSSYRVKNGDSLEKIARTHQTTVQAIKDLNGLTSDKIVVGKLLKIPEK